LMRLYGKKSKTLHENENSHQIQGIYMVGEDHPVLVRCIYYPIAGVIVELSHT
jgi:hypothetical protein